VQEHLGKTKFPSLMQALTSRVRGGAIKKCVAMNDEKREESGGKKSASVASTPVMISFELERYSKADADPSNHNQVITYLQCSTC